MSKFLLDHQIDLNTTDYLGTKLYADNLINVLSQSELVGGDMPKAYTLGLFGSWGSGKSSIIETVEKKLTSDKIKFVTYDAWQYTNDSFRRTFLKKLNDKLKTNVNVNRVFYENSSSDIKTVFRVSGSKLLILLIIISALLTVLSSGDFIKKLSPESISLSIFISLIASLLLIIIRLGNNYKTTINSPLYFAAEQFEELYKRIITKVFTNKWYIRKEKLQKLIVVVDNIDRCDAKSAFQILKDIKTFLIQHDENHAVIFLIPIDVDSLKKIDRTFDINEFLRKIFNVSMHIKPYMEADMYQFAKEVNDNNHLGFKNETINLVSKEFSKNPRRIVQLFNNLTLEKGNYKSDFSRERETLICSILILKEEYPSLYDKVIEHPSILIKKAGSNGHPEIMGDESQFLSTFENIVEFNYPHDLDIILSDVNKILRSEKEDFGELFRNFNAERILSEKIYKVPGFYDSFIHYTKQSIRKKLIHQFMNSYNLIVKINEISQIQSQLNLRLKELFIDKHGFGYDDVFEKVQDFDALCEYQQTLENQGLNTIKNKLINKIEIKTLDEFDYSQKLFDACLRKFNTDKDYVALKTAVILNYKYVDIENVKFSDAQVDKVFSEGIIQEWILKRDFKGVGKSLIDVELDRILFFVDKKDTEIQKRLILICIQSMLNYVKSLPRNIYATQPYFIIEINAILKVAVDTMIKTKDYYVLNPTEVNSIINNVSGLNILISEIISIEKKEDGITKLIDSGKYNKLILSFLIKLILVSENNSNVDYYLEYFAATHRKEFVNNFKSMNKKNYPINKFYKFILHAISDYDKESESLIFEVLKQKKDVVSFERVLKWFRNQTATAHVYNNKEHIDFLKVIFNNHINESNKLILLSKRVSSNETFEEKFGYLFYN
jgi:hypothetical protein